MSVGFTPQRSVQVLGFASNGLLTPLRRLYPLAVRQTSALPTASFRFHLTMDTLAVQLTLPLAGCVEDFHLQVSAPCRAHHKKPLTIRPGARKSALGNALCACPIEPWGEQSVTLRMRPEAFRLAMNRGWDSIQHDGHHALLLEKKQHQLQINPLLTLGSYQRVSCV
jgi:hypothetical protein